MKAREDSVYDIGTARINISARTVTLNGESLRLRPKDFCLLHFLIRQGGRIATKDEILSEVWPGVAVTDNSLVKCVSQLRKALGDDLRNPRFLRSVPKVGYQLVGVVEEIPEPESLDTGSHRATAIEVQQATTIAVEYREVVSSDNQPWRRPLIWGMAAAGLILLAGAFRSLPGSRGTRPPTPIHWEEVAWWRLNEGRGDLVRDASGNKLDGHLTGGAAWDGGSLRFNGLDAAVIGSTRDVLPVGGGARTLTAWIQSAVPQVDGMAILNYGSSARGPNAASFSFGVLDDGRISFGSHIAGGFSSGTRRLDDNAWHMVTTTLEGPPSGQARIFIDGKLDHADRWATRPATSGPSWRIGRYLVPGTDFRGSIKDVRVFDRALTESQVAALYSCTAAAKDLGDYYYIPVYSPGLVRETAAAGAPSIPFRSDGMDFSGMQLAKSDGVCAMTSVEGADIGQDLRISMDVLTPSDAMGRSTQAGPYFRSRIAGPGDGLMGGRSAGYWVELQSNGMVKVRRLNPLSVVAFSPVISAFDARIFHSLAMEARGMTLQVWLDGNPIWFDQGGRSVDRVAIPAAWESPVPVGDNQGAAGVSFGAEGNRGQIGGQRVKNLTVVRLD